MSGLLRSGLLGLKALAEVAVKKVEEAEAFDLQNKVTGTVDAGKVTNLLAEKDKTIATLASAVDQLQQRVSNLEAHVGRLEVRLPPGPPPAPPPMGGAGGWIDPPAKR
jgi:hypothetical protein